MTKQDRKSDAQASGLLGDLESIRTLLDDGDAAPRGDRHDSGDAEDADEAAPASVDDGADADAGNDADVPLLEDVVHGGVGLNQTFFAGEGDFAEDADEPSHSGLDEALFKTLLSEEWRDNSRDLLEDVRDTIERDQAEWTPAATEDLNEALQERIDETIDAWLHDLVARHIDELRQVLLDAVGDQLQASVRSQLTPDGDPDGQ